MDRGSNTDDGAPEISATSRSRAGAPSSASEIDPDGWAREARAGGLTEESIDFALVALRGQTNGLYATPFDGVQQTLGREPRSFEAFVRESAATGVWTPASG